jgi:hypothetical protein
MNEYIVTARRIDQERAGKIRVHPSGRYVDPFGMKPEDISIYDIAHHLAGINRYTGGTPVPYNVAHHSVLVSREFIDRDLRLAGLLHDAAEYVLNDFASPAKRNPIMAGYVAKMDELDAMIFEVFGLDPALMKAVKPADDAIFQRETASFWGSIDEKRRIRPLPAAESERLFLAEFRMLAGEHQLVRAV